MLIVMIENAVNTQIARKNLPQGAETARWMKRASRMKPESFRSALEVDESSKPQGAQPLAV
jgi:hypothetical protein